MEELIKGTMAAPLSTIFVLAGILFLVIAVVGNISGKIEPGPRARILSGILGIMFVTAGILIHWLPLKEQSFGSAIANEVPAWIPAYPGWKVEKLSSKTDPGSGEPDRGGPRLDMGSAVPDRYANDGVDPASNKPSQRGGFFFTTDDDWAAVRTFYIANMTEEGWQVNSSENLLDFRAPKNGRTITVYYNSPNKHYIVFTENFAKLRRTVPGRYSERPSPPYSGVPP